VLGTLGDRFAKLWTASTASALGSGLTVVAAPLYVSARTSSPLVVSATTGVAMLPWLLFSLPAGVLVDRVDRRRLMIAIDWARVVVMGVLAVAVLTGWSSIVLLDLVLFLVNTGETAFESAAQSMLPAVVPRERLERANGWLFGGVMLMGHMIAGPLGGFLFIVSASVPFFANAGTYVASAILIALVSGTYRAAAREADPPRPAGGERGPGVWTEVAAGFRWLLGQRMLRTMAFLIGLLNVTLTAASAVLVLLAKERLHVGSAGYGALFTCMAVGTIVGSAVGDRVIGRFTASWTIRVGLLVEAATHLTLAVATNVYLVGAVLVAFGVHAALWTIVGNSLRQRLTPPAMIGRVSSTTLFVSAGGNCVGALLGGLIAGAFGITAPYWVGFVVAVAVVAATWRVFSKDAVAAAYAEPAVAAAEAAAEPA
jgi:MFS family permease